MSFKTFRDGEFNSLKVYNTFSLPPQSTFIPPAGSVAYQGSNVLISNGQTWNGIGSSLPGATLVFRPTYSGPSGMGIYADWAELCAALPSIPAPKYIYFDDSLIPFGTPMVIPPGSWDMMDVTWVIKFYSIHTPPNLFVQINISDGATINNLGAIDGPCIITYFGTTVPAISLFNAPPDRHILMSLMNGVQLVCAGTQPFVRLFTGFAEIIMGFACVLVTSPVAVVQVDIGTTMIVPMQAYGQVQDNVLGGPGEIIIPRIVPGAVISIPLVQPQATQIGVSTAYTSPDTYQRSVPPTANDDGSIGYKPGDIWIDTSANKFYLAIGVNPVAAIWNGPF